MKIQTMIKAAVLSAVALALLAVFTPRHSVHAAPNHKQPVGIFFPPISAGGKIKSQINVATVASMVGNAPAPQKVRLLFDIFKAEPPPAPIVGTPNDNISDNPPAPCVKYQWVARQQCEVDVSETTGGTLTLSHANLNEEHLIRAGIIIIGSEAGFIAPCDIVSSVEVVANDSSIAVLHPLHDHPK